MTHATPAELKTRAAALLAELLPRAERLTPRERLQIPAQDMPSQSPEVRRGNMDEVAVGYSAEQARVESMRCMQCKNAPCIEGCPVRINIPAFLKAAAAGDFDKAIAIIREASLLPAVCGRVCPQETQCQQNCTVGRSLKDVGKAVMIGRVERFVADLERDGGAAKPQPVAAPTGRKVAIIGTGPAGVTVAADVRRAGHAVTMFEAFHKPGGVLMYGIPEFRLPKAIVQFEIDVLKRMGVEVRTNYVVGRTRKLSDMLAADGFHAAFIGTGAGLPKFMDIPGENLVGVFSANEYLTRANLMRAFDFARADTPIFHSRQVAVLGGGNVAMDSARMAVRLGAERVNIVYRRTEREMPARVEEVEHAREEGVVFHMLTNAKRIVGNADENVAGMECLRYELGAPDESGRRRPVVIPGSEFMMPVDTVIVAIGNECNPLIPHTTPGLQINKWGNIVVDNTGKTSLEHVYAGGDIVLGAATVILAMGEGRRAAASINAILGK